MQTEKHEIGDLRIALDRYGAGKPVIMLHGWPEWRGCWERLAPLLADEYELIAPDFRNFGETETLDRTPRIIDADLLAADLMSLIDRLGYDSVGLIAHDVGAYVAQAFARRYPDRAGALFFFNCPHALVGRRVADADQIQAVWYQYFYQLPLAAQLGGGSASTTRLYLKHFLDNWAGRPGLFDEKLDRWTEIYAAPGRFADSIACYRGTLDARLRQLRFGGAALAPIEAPASVLWGERDPVTRAEWLDALPELFTDLHVATLPTIGHFPHWEAPEAAAKAIRTHFARTIGADAAKTPAPRKSVVKTPPPSSECDYPRRILKEALWVPVLTHLKTENGAPQLDGERLRAHLAWLGQHTRQAMIAGSTGEGWSLDDASFEALLRLWAEPGMSDDFSLIIGCLDASTEDVLRRIETLSRVAETAPDFGKRIIALAACPHVDPDASQLAILAHFTTLFARSPWPIALYQLPQVTGCEMAGHTVKTLIDRGRPVPFIKDSSGLDRLARAGLPLRPAALLRGAEDRYAECLFPEGEYDGWLLSTGNVLAPELQAIAEAMRRQDYEAARGRSSQVQQAVADVFASAADCGVPSPFAAVNKAMDHVRAFGADWQAYPVPRLWTGETLPHDLLMAAEKSLHSLQVLAPTGYMNGN